MTYKTDRTKCSASPDEGTTKLLISILAGFLLLVCSGSNAVQVTSSGTGQALIIPIYSTEGGFDTLLAVSNTHESSESTVALKVNFIDADERIAGSFNVYLRPLSTWALGLRSENGQSLSGEFTSGCVLQAGPGGEAELISSLQLESSVGYVEIVEMGLVSEPTLVQAIDEGNCPVIEQYWADILDDDGDPNTVVDAPRGVVRANIALINVALGTMYAVDATGLQNFRNSEFHTPPGEPAPDLSSADNAPDVTTSTNCYVTPCVVDEWSDPVDAVSAALMAREITGEYTVNDAIGARTEWVLAAPTIRFASDSDSAARNTGAFLLLTDRQGERQPNEPDPVVGQPQPPFSRSFESPVTIDRPVMSMYFTSESDPNANDSVLALPDSGPIPAKFGAGLMRAGFSRFDLFSEPAQTSLGGRDYFGAPVIGVVLQEVNNGVIPSSDGGFRIASFGNAYTPSYSLEGTE
ncbi:MAG: hypothetical protein WD397_05295 [Wenzhouxiangellaceae bacterium]